MYIINMILVTCSQFLQESRIVNHDSLGTVNYLLNSSVSNRVQSYLIQGISRMDLG